MMIGWKCTVLFWRLREPDRKLCPDMVSVCGRLKLSDVDCSKRREIITDNWSDHDNDAMRWMWIICFSYWIIRVYLDYGPLIEFVFFVWHRLDIAKSGNYVTSTLARRALRHEVDTSPTVAPKSEDLATSNAHKTSVQTVGHGYAARRRNRRTVCGSSVRRRNKPSALSVDQPISGSCDNEQVGIRTRRMSAADAANNLKSENLAATQNVGEDNCSRLSSASTAPVANLPTDVAGKHLKILLGHLTRHNILNWLCWR